MHMDFGCIRCRLIQTAENENAGMVQDAILVSQFVQTFVERIGNRVEVDTACLFNNIGTDLRIRFRRVVETEQCGGFRLIVQWRGDEGVLRVSNDEPHRGKAVQIPSFCL